MSAKGLFCVFEGIDGAGKSTLVQHLAEKARLKYDPEAVLVLQEPSLLPSGQKIRQLLQRKTQLKSAEWLELFIADRRLNLKENVEPAQKAGKLILQDRYFYSTAAYQTVPTQKGLSPQHILEYNLAQGFCQPDLLFFIALDPKVAFTRIQQTRQHRESFEEEERLKAIHAHYLSILPQNTIKLDGTLASQALCEQVFAHIQAKRSSRSLL